MPELGALMGSVAGVIILCVVILGAFIFCGWYIYVERKYPKKEKEPSFFITAAFITMMMIGVFAIYDLITGGQLLIKKYFLIFLLFYFVVLISYYTAYKAITSINFEKLKKESLKRLFEVYRAVIPANDLELCRLRKFKIIKEGEKEIRDDIAVFVWGLEYGAGREGTFLIALNARSCVPVDITPEVTQAMKNALDVRDSALGKSVLPEKMGVDQEKQDES